MVNVVILLQGYYDRVLFRTEMASLEGIWGSPAHSIVWPDPIQKFFPQRGSQIFAFFRSFFVVFAFFVFFCLCSGFRPSTPHRPPQGFLPPLGGKGGYPAGVLDPIIIPLTFQSKKTDVIFFVICGVDMIWFVVHNRDINCFNLKRFKMSVAGDF